MEISTERAFQILDAYCKHGTRLMISGRISGEEAASIAEVTRVWPITESIMIKLFCDDDGKCWDIFLPLRRANFSTDPMGDTSFEQSEPESEWVPSCHLDLYAWFPRGTTLVFAEEVN